MLSFLEPAFFKPVTYIQAIKKAIEFVLNNNANDIKIGDYTFSLQPVYTEKTYTERELLEAEEKSFNSSRKVTKSGGELSIKDMALEYPTFEDYKNSQK